MTSSTIALDPSTNCQVDSAVLRYVQGCPHRIVRGGEASIDFVFADHRGILRCKTRLFPDQDVGKRTIDLPQHSVADAGKAAKQTQIELPSCRCSIGSRRSMPRVSRTAISRRDASSRRSPRPRALPASQKNSMLPSVPQQSVSTRPGQPRSTPSTALPDIRCQDAWRPFLPVWPWQSAQDRCRARRDTTGMASAALRRRANRASCCARAS